MKQSTVHSPQSTVHGPRSTVHSPRSTVRTGRVGFTLIELLIVISIIALLAALIFPLTGAISRNKIRAKARAELAQTETAINSYKNKLGHYPPDNGDNYWVNQLYFELMGTVPINNYQAYKTIDGSASITTNSFPTVFGVSTPIGGFVNCNRGGGGDEGQTATTFLTGLKPDQVGDLTNNVPGVKILVCSVPWPEVSPSYWPAGVRGLNPIRYNSSNPKHNPSSYDLWIDVVISGKTNRICNWSTTPLIVGTPLPYP